jgi:uncharacterized protein YoxC
MIRCDSKQDVGTQKLEEDFACILFSADQRNMEQMYKTIEVFESQKQGMQHVQQELIQKTTQLSGELALSERINRELKTITDVKIKALEEENIALRTHLESTQNRLNVTEDKLFVALKKIKTLQDMFTRYYGALKLACLHTLNIDIEYVKNKLFE